jgi:hypothetical protein
VALSIAARWRASAPVNRAFSGLGLGAAAALLATLPWYPSQVVPILTSASMLSALSIALLFWGRQAGRKPEAPPQPPREVNEAVMPIPEVGMPVAAVAEDKRVPAG